MRTCFGVACLFAANLLVLRSVLYTHKLFGERVYVYVCMHAGFCVHVVSLM